MLSGEQYMVPGNNKPRFIRLMGFLQATEVMGERKFSGRDGEGGQDNR